MKGRGIVLRGRIGESGERRLRAGRRRSHRCQHGTLADDLETLSKDPYGAGWIAKIKIADEANLKNLMDYAAYQKQCAEEAH